MLKTLVEYVQLSSLLMSHNRSRMLGLDLLSFDFSHLSDIIQDLPCPGPMSPLLAVAVSSSVPVLLFLLLGVMFAVEAGYRSCKGTYTSLVTLRYFKAFWRLLLLIFSCTPAMSFV